MHLKSQIKTLLVIAFAVLASAFGLGFKLKVPVAHVAQTTAANGGKRPGTFDAAWLRAIAYSFESLAVRKLIDYQVIVPEEGPVICFFLTRTKWRKF